MLNLCTQHPALLSCAPALEVDHRLAASQDSNNNHAISEISSDNLYTER
jgi:hypothetical protein